MAKKKVAKKEVPAAPRPTTFIGSSVEGLKIAQALAANPEYVAASDIWPNIFGKTLAECSASGRKGRVGRVPSAGPTVMTLAPFGQSLTIFDLSGTTIEALEKATEEHEFAICNRSRSGRFGIFMPHWTARPSPRT